MSYCPNCGKEIIEGAAFCPECGTKQNGWQPARRNTTPRGRLHCPSCRSTNLTPIIESTSTIGSVGRVSKNIAVTETNVKNKSFWMCQECGHKFRNLEDLIAENKRVYKFGKICFRALCGFLAVFSVLIGSLPGADSKMTIFSIVLSGVAWFISEKWGLEKWKAKSDAEERKLRKACFD
ncbi:MAG: zinc-ribbon domain-containing protein [Oscillospiraceae bacterium]|nr:zinc-ribbon domain-containing protein [Oscillospiraceae bacterium]